MRWLFWLWPLVLYAVVAVVKAVWLTSNVFPSEPGLFALSTIRVDLGPFAVLAAAVAVEWRFGDRRMLRWVLAALFAVVVLLYWLDTLTLIVFHQRLWLWDVLRWVPQPSAWRPLWKEALGSLAVTSLIVASFVARSRRPVPESTGRPRTGIRVLAVATAILAWPVPHGSAVDYAFGRNPTVFLEETKTVAAGWSSETCTKSCATTIPAMLAARPPAKTRNVVVVIVESFGSHLSKRLSGIHNEVPAFDALIDRGTLFRNYFATGAHSFNATVAMFGGVVPLPVVRGQDEREEWWSRIGWFPGPMHAWNQAGWDLHFLSGYHWINATTLQFTEAAGFRRIEWPGNASQIAVFGTDPWIADARLFRAGVDVVNSWRGEPGHLLVLQTAETHGFRPGEKPWRNLDTELLRFVRTLEQQGFFETGWLFVTGDHRMPFPLTEAEANAYGLSAMARVPLLALGPQFPAGRTDERLFSHVDLFRRMPDFADPAAPAAPFVVWVDAFGSGVIPMRVLRREGPGVVAHAAEVVGFDVRWKTTPPPDFEAPWNEIQTVRRTVECLSTGRLVPSLCESRRPR